MILRGMIQEYFLHNIKEQIYKNRKSLFNTINNNLLCVNNNIML